MQKTSKSNAPWCNGRAKELNARYREAESHWILLGTPVLVHLQNWNVGHELPSDTQLNLWERMRINLVINQWYETSKKECNDFWKEIKVCYWTLIQVFSIRKDRWVHFQQNAGLRLFVHTWSVHDIYDWYQFTRTFGGFSAQSLSKLFLKEFTVLLLTTSLGRAFQVEDILIG